MSISAEVLGMEQVRSQGRYRRLLLTGVTSGVLASSLGVADIVWGTLLTYLVFSGIPQVIYVSRLLAEIRNSRSSGGMRAAAADQ